jgi:hypothetical protein
MTLCRMPQGAHNFITAIEASVAHDFHAALRARKSLARAKAWPSATGSAATQSASRRLFELDTQILINQ